MSGQVRGHAIPLWKQELLKRKQAKASHEKLTSEQVSNSKPRTSSANSTTSSLNHRSAATEKRSDIHTAQQHGFNKNHGDVLNKGTTYNRNIVSEEPVDSRDTRHKSENLKSNISKIDSGRNRLDNFEDRQMNRNAGKFNKKFDFVRGSYDMHGMTQHNRTHRQKGKTNFTIVDEDNKDGLIIGNGVDSEHIRPRDLKRMWQQQAMKDDTLPQTHVTHSKLSSPTTHVTKEVSKGPPPSLQDLHNRHNTQVIASPTSAPKAYKSPYAKTHWHRQASMTDEKSTKGNVVLQPKRDEVKLHAIKPSLSNGNAANDEKVEDEHIQSVKSLLGLFGGKVKPNIGRKISDNVSLGNKTAKQLDGKEHHTSETKMSASKKPGLFKHHSEPNLFFPAGNNVFTDVTPMPKKSPTSEPEEEVVSPSHHVSQGIQERMTRLRRASHSNMEEMEGFMEYQNGLKNDPNVEENHKMAQRQSIQQKNIVPEKHLSNNLENNKPATVQVSVGNHDREELFNNVSNFTLQNDSEKPRLSGNVNTSNKLPSPVSNEQNTIDTRHNNKMDNTQSKPEEIVSKSQDESKSLGQQNLAEQPIDKPSSVFGPRVAKKAAIRPDLTDVKEHKSESKYQSKQSNYVVENNQSDSSLHNHVVSTEYSTGIKQNKQEAKPVIKNKENVGKVEEKSEKKPRRRGLNVVDPLAVLQLTKDPILLKEKPSSAELGLLKELPTGRKPKVEIIKHEPDKKAKIAQINRAWDLDKLQPNLKENNVARKTMPASTVQVSPVTPHSVPVTSIDEIPVSVIDDNVANKSTKDAQPKSNSNTLEMKFGNTTFYDGTLSSASVESGEIDEEFIPVSSIDAEADLGPPPEIVFDKMPANLKSCFSRNGKKRGNLSFFEHVFIHDYQSETAAASDWDIENGTSFSSYTPAALKQYEDVGKTYNAAPAPTPLPATPATPPTRPAEETRYDEPLITYNEEESVDFTESSDSTAGALLF